MTKLIKPSAACRAFEAGLPLTILLLLAPANGSIAAAPQIIFSVSFQQSAVDLGKTNTFTVSVAGDPPLAFQWRLGESDLPGQTNSSLAVGPAHAADEGDYSVVVTNLFGAVTSSPIRFWVVPSETNFVKDNFTNTAGLRLPYFYLSPGGYDPARRYPLVYWLHGMPGDETDITNANFGLPSYGSNPCLKVVASFRQQETDPVILVWPTRRAGDAYVGWTAQYLQLLCGLLDHLLLQFSVDTNRIYVEGISEGFHATWDLLGMRPGLFAAGRISAGWKGNVSAASIKDVPLWIWCARNDEAGQLPNTQQAIRALRLVGGNPIYTEYQTGGHGNGIGIGYMTPVIVDWLLAQRRGQPSTNQPLLTITSPTVGPLLTTAATNLALAGSAAALGQNVTRVTCSNLTFNLSASTSGTNSWTASNVPLRAGNTNLITVTAATTSWASAYGGETTFSDALSVFSSPIRASLSLGATGTLLNWTGGTSPFQVERATELTPADWIVILTNATPPVDLPVGADAEFYRVSGP